MTRRQNFQDFIFIWAVLLLVVTLALCSSTRVHGQSFYHPTTIVSDREHDKQCKAIHNTKTAKQKRESRKLYSAKRKQHQSGQWFTDKQRNKDMRKRKLA